MGNKNNSNGGSTGNGGIGDNVIPMPPRPPSKRIYGPTGAGGMWIPGAARASYATSERVLVNFDKRLYMSFRLPFIFGSYYVGEPSPFSLLRMTSGSSLCLGAAGWRMPVATVRAASEGEEGTQGVLFSELLSLLPCLSARMVEIEGARDIAQWATRAERVLYSRHDMPEAAPFQEAGWVMDSNQAVYFAAGFYLGSAAHCEGPSSEADHRKMIASLVHGPVEAVDLFGGFTRTHVGPVSLAALVSDDSRAVEVFDYLSTRYGAALVPVLHHSGGQLPPQWAERIEAFGYLLGSNALPLVAGMAYGRFPAVNRLICASRSSDPWTGVVLPVSPSARGRTMPASVLPPHVIGSLQITDPYMLGYKMVGMAHSYAAANGVPAVEVHLDEGAQLGGVVPTTPPLVIPDRDLAFSTLSILRDSTTLLRDVTRAISPVIYDVTCIDRLCQRASSLLQRALSSDVETAGNG